MHSGNKYYVLIEAYPFTFLTPRDSFMSMVEPGARVKIDWDQKNLYVWTEEEDRWWLTADVTYSVIDKLQEIENK